MAETGKTAIVTGAGSGIGRAVSLALHRAGFSVALAGRRLAQLEETASMGAPGAPGRLIAIPADVTQPDSVRGLFEQTRAEFGRLDVLFNNAGLNTPGAIEDLSLEDWQRVVNVNLTGVFLCAQQAIRLMKDQMPNGGRIINNGSISAHTPRPDSAPYTATKHAVTGLTKSISLDGRKHNIACGQIDIGNAATDMTQRMDAGALQPDGTMKPEPRVDVNLVADAVVYMAGLPLEANVLFMTVMATTMPFTGRG